MYRNPLGGDLSDYNSLKNQINNGARVKKYEKVKLETEPTELQKYYQYLTYQEPILNEINYVSERMRNENINKQKEDFNFIEKLKEEREKQMKEKAHKEKLMKNQEEELFGNSSLEKKDMTPNINTDNDMERIKASNLLKASILRATIQPIYREGAEYQRELATQASQAETENPFQVVKTKKERKKKEKGRTLNL